MSEAITVDHNLPSSIGRRFDENQRSWWPVLLFLPARLIFAFVAQGLAAGWLALRGSTEPWQDAAGWWLVYSTITDILCLLTLFWLTRREGLTLIDLFGVRGKAAVQQLAWTPAYLLAVLPGTAVAAVMTQMFYGTPLTPMMTVVDLPPAAVLYAQIVWPLLWVVTEELVYLGYLLPRLEALSGTRWVAVIVVVLFWALQHLAIPWIPDGTYIVWRLLSAGAAIALFPVVFILGRRRLMPLIAVHYIADLSTALIATGVLSVG